MKTIYWVSTSLVALSMLASAVLYFFHDNTIQGFRTLGYPDHFRVQLAVLKIIGALVLITPGIPLPFKEWAYAGIGLFLITAIVAHAAHKDPIALNLINVVLFALLIVSNIYLRKSAA